MHAASNLVLSLLPMKAPALLILLGMTATFIEVALHRGRRVAVVSDDRVLAE
jgi:hypothetical protein